MSSSNFLKMSLRTSPHVARRATVDVIMLNVVGSLCPIVLVAIYTFGLSAALLLLTTTLACLLTEEVICRYNGQESTLVDYSAIITGLLLGLTLPPGFPLWMAAVGGVVSISLGKTLFGGLGFNVFNPALVGRAFLQAAFPVAITTWSEALQAERFSELISTTLTFPLAKPVVDGITGATPLASMKFDQQAAPIYDMFLGGVSGSTGETSAILILLCGLYLAFRKMLDWRIPVGILLSVVLFSALLHFYNPDYPSSVYMLFSGGLMLGAWFMATDMVTSPITPLGVWSYAILIGFLIVIIRVYGGLPEGVMYAILLGNAATPLLHRWTQPKVYGRGEKQNV